MEDVKYGAPEMRALGELAQQMVHDIRSPLSALNMVVGSLHGQIPENKRLLMCSAVRRISEISGRLLPKGKAGEAHFSELTHALESVMSEQRIQYGTRLMTLSVDRTALDDETIFTIDPVEFARMISNLMTNAVEATDGHGRIAIRVRSVAKVLWIVIEDNGCGICKKLLSQIGRKGVTRGKRGGSGLGLFHAKKTIERAGGRIKIDSIFGRGTKITLGIPAR